MSIGRRCPRCGAPAPPEFIASIGGGGTATPPGLTFDGPTDIGRDLVTIAKLALSVVPAGLVGGLTAATNTRR